MVWSKSLGLATDIELDSKASRRRAEEEKRRKGDERARRRSVEEQARRRETEVRRQDDALIDGRAWTTNCDSLREVVMRGGSYNSVPRDLRFAYRLRFPPSNRRFGLGFRLVQDLNP